MVYLEDVATVGLGYLVYKRLMAELAVAPVKESVTVKAGELLGWDTAPQFEEGLKLWAGVPEGCTVSGGFFVNCPPPEYTGANGAPTWCTTDWAGVRTCTTTPPTITQAVDIGEIDVREITIAADIPPLGLEPYTDISQLYPGYEGYRPSL